MKKLFTLFLMTILAVGTMMADWQPSDTQATRIDGEGTNGQVQMKTLTTPEGNIVLSWLRGEIVDGVFSYQLHLQLFDTNGNARFGDEGIVVCDKPTRTWTTDYALALAPNGDILLAYNDIRNDVEMEEKAEVYVYRYTQQGAPVWDTDGIFFDVPKIHETAFSLEDISPAVCVSGNNIFVAAVHDEYYMEEANEDNWSPSPWFPNQPMPDSVQVTDSKWVVMPITDEGVLVPESMMMINSKVLVMKPAPDGKIYFVYDNEETGLDAQLINSEMENVWNEPLTIEPRPLSTGMYMPTPLVIEDGQGGLFLSYRALESWSGYQVLNHLNESGEFFAEAPSCNNSIDGDAGTAEMGTNYGLAFVAWEYDFDKYYMNVNVLDDNGDFCWPDDDVYGKAIDENSSWGFKPVKVIPQEDGWVLLYGNLTSWNGANFMVVKIDEIGGIVWQKQICEDNFKSSGFSVAYDENYAYVFYTQDEEYDDNWNVIPGSGGMFVMCVDISGGHSTAINEVTTSEPVKTEIYTIDGRRVNELESGVNIIRMIDGNGNVTTKKVLK